MDSFIYIVVFAFALALIFYAFIFLKGSRFAPRSSKKLDRAFVTKEWTEIENVLKRGDVSDLNMAIMHADKIFDHVLKAVTGREDCSMADRLKLAKDKFSSYEVYQGVWDAHKTRNRIAHEVNANVLALESKRSIEKFKRGLKDLRAL